MKKFWRITPALGVLCFIGAGLMFALNTIAVIAASFGFVRPFIYMEYLRLPLWSVVLPALGILMFFPLALRKAFTFIPAPEEEKAAAPVDWRQAIGKWRSKLHLKPL